MMAELMMTDADNRALAKCPKGWFEWFDVISSFRCPEFRLKRLVERGKLKKKVTGNYPDIEVRYRKVKGNDHD